MRSLRIPIAVVALVAASCAVQVSSYEGKECNTAADCPYPYTCAIARQAGVKTCEVLYPDLEVGTRCAGTGTAYYCAPADCTDAGSWDPNDVKPILDCYCRSCHSVPSAAGAPGNFRLDQFADDSNGLPGAHSMAGRVAARSCQTGDMPPTGYAGPTPVQRELLATWANTGARACDGGVPPRSDGGP